MATVVKTDEGVMQDAQVIGGQQPPLPGSGRTVEQQMKWLRENLPDTPEGILENFCTSMGQFSVRYWIIDNSGSMQLTDGHRVVTTTGGNKGLVTSSRWEELCDSLVFHSTLAANLGAPTEFRLLNESAGVPRGGIVSVGFGGGSDPGRDLEQMRLLLSTQPHGRTPLCTRIREVTEAVRQREQELRSLGKRALVVIASDGEPSDGDIQAALRPLAQLPVFVVLRLCTEEDQVVEFWNGVDADLELDLEVLDDPVGEAQEVNKQNPFLTYGMPLHRLREWGCTNKIFDTIDEATLSLSEINNVVELIYGADAKETLPHPDLNFQAFIQALDHIQNHDRNAGHIFNPLTRRYSDWINTKIINRTYRRQANANNKAPCCTIL